MPYPCGSAFQNKRKTSRNVSVVLVNPPLATSTKETFLAPTMHCLEAPGICEQHDGVASTRTAA